MQTRYANKIGFTIGMLGLLALFPALRADAQATLFADSSNTAGDSMFLDSASYGDANQILMITPVYQGVYENFPIGVWYDGGAWAVFNQTTADMPVGSVFNVYAGKPASNVFVQQATQANTAGSATYINSAATNGQPSLKLFVTPDWNPGDVYAGYDTHNIGVHYDHVRDQWTIFNEDGAAMQPGMAFNVVVLPVTRGLVFEHKAGSTNTVGNHTYLPVGKGTYGPPVIFVTPIKNVPYDHPLGVWYDPAKRKWAIYNQDGAAMPIGAAFNVWVNPYPG